MLAKYRKSFFRVFFVFFLLVSPFLALYSLGYTVNILDRSIQNQLTARVETFPGSAEVFAGEKRLIERTTDEIFIRDGQVVDIQIKKHGFLNEELRLWSPSGQNSSTLITDYYLMPERSFEAWEYKDFHPTAILSNNYILLNKDGDLYISFYNFSSGLVNPIKIETNNKFIPSKNHWVSLRKKIFYNKLENLLIFETQAEWKITRVDTDFPFKVMDILPISDRGVLLLDNQNNSWVYNLEKQEYEFFESEVLAGTFTETPEFIWLIRKNQVYKIPQADDAFDESFIFENYSFSNKNLLNLDFDYLSKLNQEINFFEAKNLFNGTLLKIADKIYYIPDYNQSLWQIVADKVMIVNTQENMLFWLDKNYQLYGYYADLDYFVNFGKADLNSSPDFFKITYYPEWKRLLIYSDTQIVTLWIDNTNTNTSIISYKPKLWIENKRCFDQPYEKSIFCLNRNKLEVYKNTALNLF